MTKFNNKKRSRMRKSKIQEIVLIKVILYMHFDIGIQELRRKRRSKKVWRRRKITIPVDIESGEEEYKGK